LIYRAHSHNATNSSSVKFNFVSHCNITEKGKVCHLHSKNICHTLFCIIGVAGKIRFALQNSLWYGDLSQCCRNFGETGSMDLRIWIDENNHIYTVFDFGIEASVEYLRMIALDFFCVVSFCCLNHASYHFLNLQEFSYSGLPADQIIYS
jgi:hypothetical protein